MTVIWQKRKGGDLFEVRTAGYSVRLYSNGVFHSQWNPRHPIAGNLWDLLLLPVFFLPPAEPKRILLLGLGGGAVVRQLQHFFPGAKIVAVELEPLHIQVAKRFFKLKNCELICDDAVRWLKGYRGEEFDLIIDDLFSHSAGEAERAVAVDNRWAKQLLRHLKAKGVLAVNFSGSKELKSSALCKEKIIKLASGMQFKHPLYENAIGAFSREKLALSDWRENLKKYPELDQNRKSCRLNYNVRKVL